jgi:ribosomal protein L39E
VNAMSKSKEGEKKEFLISERKKIGPGLTNAPVWIIQKAGKRIWNKRQNRHWSRTDLGNLYKKKKAEQKGKKKVKSGKKKKKKGKRK